MVYSFQAVIRANATIKRETTTLGVEYLGIEPERFQASWCSASEAIKFAEVVTNVTKELREVGPNRLFIDEGKEHGAKASG